MASLHQVAQQAVQDGTDGQQAQSVAVASPEAYQPEHTHTSPSGTEQGTRRTLPEVAYSNAFKLGALEGTIRIALIHLAPVPGDRAEYARNLLSQALAEVSK
jgi:hypothetical protein